VRAAFARRALRGFLQLAAVAVLLAVPLQAFNATSDGLPAVNKLPRFALVIGNGRYANVPLKNAPNDAKAVAAELQRMGFDVTLKLDATRADMIETIRAFGAKLTKQKGVGLFYYAGHGAQLAWRNYLIPVDAAIKNVAEIGAQAVDMDTLLDSITRARNPMNLVVLDACRDNPFGGDVQVQQKGLSQVDAPPGTLLAYATAPGNTAADGTGANGLYTANVLREMQAEGAKIEDVFKRVRLNVRRASHGMQVPWESTSLEEDFYFLPPKQARKLTPDEIERQFDEELAVWDRIHASTEVAAFEHYLRRYPSGKFSELAQFRLDRLLEKQGERAVKVASDRTGSNPYSKGTARADPNFAVGDTYAYRRADRVKPAETNYSMSVTDVAENAVTYNKGSQVRDFLGNVAYNTRYGEYTGAEGGAAQFYTSEYAVGKKWTARYRVKGKDGKDWTSEYDFKVVGREKIALPSGEFDAFKVVGRGSNSLGALLEFNYWIAPDRVRRPLVVETRVVGSKTNRTFTDERDELVSFRQLRQPQ
jgi:hypothetical protein